MNQRWRHRRARYRVPDEVIKASEYDIATIAGDEEARTFVGTHHYSQSYPAARFRFGLYHKTNLAGVAVFSVPCNEKSLTNVFPFSPALSADLGRFVLLDSVAGNGESWFLARCFEVLRREGLAGVVAFSDPLPRRSLDGSIVHRGHIGTIYQAHNGVYLGRSKSRLIHLLPDGSVFSARTVQKIRAQESGWQYGVRILERFGATPFTGDAVAWLQDWLPRLTRQVKHPGNHKYAWGLERTARRMLPASLPFPKANPLFPRKPDL